MIPETQSPSVSAAEAVPSHRALPLPAARPPPLPAPQQLGRSGSSQAWEEPWVPPSEAWGCRGTRLQTLPRAAAGSWLPVLGRELQGQAASGLWPRREAENHAGETALRGPRLRSSDRRERALPFSRSAGRRGDGGRGGPASPLHFPWWQLIWMCQDSELELCIN